MCREFSGLGGCGNGSRTAWQLVASVWQPLAFNVPSYPPCGSPRTRRNGFSGTPARPIPCSRFYAIASGSAASPNCGSVAATVCSLGEAGTSPDCPTGVRRPDISPPWFPIFICSFAHPPIFIISSPVFSVFKFFVWYMMSCIVYWLFVIATF